MAFSPLGKVPDVSRVLRARLSHHAPLPPPVPHPGLPQHPITPPSTFQKVGGTPNMNAAAEAVNAQLDPILQNITEDYNQQAQQASDQIGGRYGAYADWLGGQTGIQHALYGHAIKVGQNTAEGVKGNIMQAGEHAAAGLAGSLSQAGLPANAGGTDINLSAMGGGSSDAAYALGQASIQALKSAENAAIGYASKLPGFAKLEGDYQTQTVLSQLAAAMTKQLAATTAEAPGLYYQIYNDLEDRRRQAAQDAERIREFNVTRQDNLNRKKAGIAGPNAPTVAGRNAYWQSAAAQRTKDTGDLWVGTNTGIRPADADPRKPGIQRVRTTAGQGADYLNAQRGVNTRATVARVQQGQQRIDVQIASLKERMRAARAREAQAATKDALAAAQKITANLAKTLAALQKKKAATTKKKPTKLGAGTFDPSTGKYG